MIFLKNSLIKRIFSNHFLKIISGATSFGLIALIARFTNSNVLGEFTTIYATILLISGIAFWGLADGLILLKNKFEFKKVIANSLVLCILNALLSFVVINFLFYDLSIQLRIFVNIIIVSNLMHNLSSTIFRIIGKYNISIYFSSIQINGFFLLLLVFSNFLNLKLDSESLIKLYLGSHLFSLVILIIYCFSIKSKKYFISGEFIYDKNVLTCIYKHNTPLMMSDVLNNFVGTIDILVLNNFLSFTEIANYKVATTFGKLIKISLSSFSNYMLPELSEMIHEKSIDLQAYIKLNYKYIFRIALVMVLSVISFGEIIINSVFGQEYDTAYFMLLILLVGYSYNNFSGPNGTILLASGKIKELFRIDLITNLIGILLLFVLTWMFSFWGSTFATVIIMMVYNSLKNRAVRIEIPLYGYIINKIYLAWGFTLILIAFVFYMKYN